MPVRTIRVRVHGGRLEPLEELRLEEGSELLVTLELPETAPSPAGPPRLLTRNLGAIEPLTRETIYEDVLRLPDEPRRRDP